MKRAKKAAKKRVGRPSKLTPAVLKRIVDGLSEGTPLTVICSPPAMPATRTVADWMEQDADFSAAIARARDAGFDRIALDALRIADTPLEGIEVEETVQADGEGDETPSERKIRRKDMLGHRKLQVETRLKLLAKWDPKRYGERMAQEISGPNGGPVTVAPAVQLTPDQDAALRRVIEDAQERVRRV
jgi:hypothetical protein